MIVPKITGIIDRRILINYRVDKEVLENYLPKPFKPKLVEGKGIAGICLIRLKEIRPKGLPKQIGVSSENGAHRIAVEWYENGELKEGVFIPRRDTSSILNSAAGGTVFPGIHHLAKFSVRENDGIYKVAFISKDNTSLSIVAKENDSWNKSSIFTSLDSVSEFFKKGAIGYSPIKGGFEGLELRTQNWKVLPLGVENVRSSFFENELIFPKGSIEFDNALLMKGVDHQWVGLKKMVETNI